MTAACVATVGSAVASLAAGWPSPLEAPAEWLMEWTPLPIASFLLLHAGAAAHPAALLGAFALLLLCGGVAAGAASLLQSGRPLLRPAMAGILAGALLFLLFGAVPAGLATVGLLLYVGTLTSPMIGRVRGGERRDFLARTGAVVVGATVLLIVSSLEPLVYAVSRIRILTFRPPRGLPVPGLSSQVTPVDRFYVMGKVLQYPTGAVATWQLRVEGAVQRPLALDFAALRARPRVDRYVTMECVDNPVGGPLIGSALWSGIRVLDLLHEAGVQGGVVSFGGDDRYTESLPLEVIRATDPLVVYGMNGETLTREHGYPARLLVPGLYGFKSVKWLSRLSVHPGGVGGEWAIHGWNELPWVHTTTRIDVARRSGQRVLVAGVAFAGLRGIGEVQVRVNSGVWQTATLGPTLAQTDWRQWVIQMEAPPGAHIEVRAVDGRGAVQTGRRHGPYPAGATGWAETTI